MKKQCAKKYLMISAITILLAACNGGSSGSNKSATPAATVNELDPGSITADTPPTDGSLPAELLPPTQG